MSYTINTTSGVQLATIADGTVNTTTTSLALIGKNYAGYGIFLNENFITLLENFNGVNPPNAPLTGQLWYDNGNNVLKVYTNNNIWKVISSTTAAASAPASPITGDLWWNTSTLQLNAYSGSGWIIIGPTYTSSGGTSGAVSQVIADSGGTNHTVIIFYLKGIAYAILCSESFTPATAITGFSTLVVGLNLISGYGAYYTGSVTNALTLNSLSATDFLRATASSSNGSYTLSVGKLQTGADLLVDPTGTTNVAVYSNGTGNGGNGKDIYFNTYNAGVSGAKTALILQSSTSNVIAQNGWVTATSGGANVGTLNVLNSTYLTSANVSAALNVTGTSAFTGNVTAANITMNALLTTTYIVPSANATYSIGTLTSQYSNVYARYFNGTSITANYADLAEKYVADLVYPAGTVVKVGGTAEVTAAGYGDQAIGVVSENPALKMNDGLAGGTYIALKGRLKVNIMGPVNKGDNLIACGYGCGQTDDGTGQPRWGVALETNADAGTKLVECVVL